MWYWCCKICSQKWTKISYLYRDRIINIPEDEVLKKYISYYDYVFTNFKLSVAKYYIFSHLLSITEDLYFDKITLPNIDSSELKKTIHALIQNPNCYPLDTVKITLF